MKRERVYLEAGQMEIFDSIDGERDADDVVRDPVSLHHVADSHSNIYILHFCLHVLIKV